MEDFDLEARKEARNPVSRHEHRIGIPANDLADRAQPPLIGMQILRQRIALEKPGGLVTAGANGLLQRTQNRERIQLGNEEQIARHPDPLLEHPPVPGARPM